MEGYQKVRIEENRCFGSVEVLRKYDSDIPMRCVGKRYRIRDLLKNRILEQ